MNRIEESVRAMKVLANRHRMAILRLVLTSRRDLCVKEIAEDVGISHSLASHQLGYLSARGVVEGHRNGRTTCYVPAKTPFASLIFRILQAL